MLFRSMNREAASLGYRVVDIGNARYDAPSELIQAMLSALAPRTVVIAGGESTMKVTQAGGKGGRCTYLALAALTHLGEHDIFLPFASDGIDNSDAAGALVDTSTLQHLQSRQAPIDDALARFDTYDLLAATNDLLFTGPTEANVSDLYLALRV